MSKRNNYKPSEFFKLIKSDQDVLKYVAKYESKERLNFIIFGIYMCIFMFNLIYHYIQSTYFPVPIDINIPFTYNYRDIILNFSFVPAICIFTYFFVKYDRLLNALKPIAKTSGCIDVRGFILEYAAARSIRDDILSQGRQLYKFDVDYMEDTVIGSASDAQLIEIEAACKDIYNVSRSV